MPAIIALTSLPILRDAVGGSFTPITGTVKDADNVSLTSAPIELFRRTAGGTTWTSVATTTTDTAGAFSVTLPTGLSAGEYEYVVASGGDVSEITKQWVIGSSYVFRYSGGTPSQPIGALPFASAQSLYAPAVRHGRRWAFIGDSWTGGTGATNIVYAYAWQACVNAGLARHYPTVLAGTGGNTSENILARLNSDVINQSIDGVVVQCGTNDASQGVAVSSFIANMTEIITRVRGSGRACVVTTTPPPTSSATNVATMMPRIEAFNLWIKMIAPRLGAIVADIHGALVDPTTGYVYSSMSADSVHVNNYGHSIVAEVVSAAMLAATGTATVPVVDLVTSVPPAVGSGALTANPLMAGTVGATRPTPWYSQVSPSGSITRAIRAKSGSLRRGQWYEIAADGTSAVASVTEGVTLAAGTWAAGDILAVTGRFEIEDTAGNWQSTHAGNAAGGCSLIMTLNGVFQGLLPQPNFLTPGPYWYPITASVASTASPTLVMWWNVQVAVGQNIKARLGEFQVYNLTQLGLSSVLG